MKEDTQLICPISYEDPKNIWSEIQNDILERLPLRDVTWKHPVSSSFITIAKLPLKFLPASANLFKDTDHPFRWFLAPYVNLYVINVETVDTYKAIKPTLKQWVDFQNVKRNAWIIIYAPRNTIPLELQNKLFSRLSFDFYADRSGDRTVLIHPGTSSLPPSSRFEQANNSINEFLSKLREGVIYSFQQRLALYDSDIRRLDSSRGTPQLDFRQLFLVKESLALMYQMHQLPNEALIQYEELEALLSFAPVGILPESEWPWLYIESSKPTPQLMRSDSISSQDPRSFSTSNSMSRSMSSSMSNSLFHVETSKGMTSRDGLKENVKESKESSIDGWIGSCRNGDDILAYSMNSIRTKILKNKVSLWELYRYIFSRQVYLLLQLNKPNGCCEKGYTFITSIRSQIDRKLNELSELSSSSPSSPSSSSLSLVSSSSSIVNPRIFSESNIKNTNSISNGSYNTSNINEIRTRRLQADMWAIAASVKITRACLDAIRHCNEMINSTESGKYHGLPQSGSSNNNSIIWDEQTLPSLHHLSELLRYASSKLIKLIGGESLFRSQVHAVSTLFSCWGDLTDEMITTYPFLNFQGNKSSSTSNNTNTSKNKTDKVDKEDMGEVAEEVGPNFTIGIEEMLAGVSRRIRHISINHAYHGSHRRRRTKTVSGVSPDMSELFGSSPHSSAAAPWMEYIKPTKSVSNNNNSSNINSININGNHNQQQNVDSNNNSEHLPKYLNDEFRLSNLTNTMKEINSDDDVYNGNTYSPISDDNTQRYSQIQDGLQRDASISSQSSLSSSSSSFRRDHEAIVELKSIICEMNYILQRYRFCCYEKMDAGDILFYCNNIPRAIEYYCHAINYMMNSSGTITTTVTTYTSLLNSTVTPSNNNNSNSNNTNNNSSNNTNNTNTNSFRVQEYPLHRDFQSHVIRNIIKSTLSNLSDDDRNQEGCYGWLELRYSILRKLLLCCRIIEDKESYLFLALEILKPKYRKYRLLNSLERIWSDVCNFSNIPLETIKKTENIIESQVEMKENNSNSNSNGVDIDFKSFFRMNASFARSVDCLKGCSLFCEDYPVADVRIPILTARYIVGKPEPLILSIEIESLFDYPIEFDDIQLVYRPFSHDINSLRSTLHPPTPTSYLGSQVNNNITNNSNSHNNNNNSNTFGNNFFGGSSPMWSSPTSLNSHHRKFNFADDYLIAKVIIDSSKNTIRISPGKQNIVFLIHPSSMGEFTLYQINMKMGSWVTFSDEIGIPLTLRDRLLSDPIALSMSKLRKEILRIVVNDNALQTLITTSSLTPLGQVDILELRLSTGPNDSVSNFVIDVFRAMNSHSDINSPYLTSLSSTSPIYPSLGSISSSSSLSSAVGINFETPDNWQIIEMGPQSTRKYRCPFSVTTTSKGKNIRIMAGLTLRSLTQYIFKIPYLTASTDFRIGEVVSIPVTCAISGELIRDRCKISISQSLHTAIVTGVAIEVTSWSTGLQSTCNDTNNSIQVYRQFSVKNVSTIPIDLIAYRVAITSSSGDNFGTITLSNGPIELECLPEPSSDSSDKESRKLPSSFVSLLPQEEYFVSFRIYYQSNRMNMSDMNTAMNSMIIPSPIRSTSTASLSSSSSSSSSSNSMIMKEFESYHSSVVKFLYRRQSLEQAYTGNKEGSGGETVMFVSKAPLIESWSDFSLYLPRLDMILYGMLDKSMERQGMEVGKIVNVIYHLYLTNPHPTVHGTIKVNMNISLSNSLVWLPFRYTKRQYDVTIMEGSKESEVTIPMELIPVSCGMLKYPALEIRYMFENEQNKDSVTEILSPNGEEVLVLMSSVFFSCAGRSETGKIRISSNQDEDDKTIVLSSRMMIDETMEK